MGGAITIIDDAELHVPRAPKHKPRPRYRHIKHIINTITLETEKKEKCILIYKARRRNYYITNETISYIEYLIKDKQYMIESNPCYKQSYENIIKLRKRKNNFLLHNEKYKFMMQLDVSYGRDLNSYKTQNIDVTNIIKLYMENIVILNTYTYIIYVYDGTHVPCVSGGCYMAFDKNIIQPNKYIICPICDVKQCLNCKNTWTKHEGLTCQEFQQNRRLSNLNNVLIIRKLFKGVMQACPGCGELIEKDMEFCNKIKCRCGMYWCWACYKKDLSKLYKNPYEHYMDDPRKHKGLNGLQKKCIAGGEFTRDVKKFIVENNRRLFTNTALATITYRRKKLYIVSAMRRIYGLKPLLKHEITLREYDRLREHILNK